MWEAPLQTAALAVVARQIRPLVALVQLAKALLAAQAVVRATFLAVAAVALALSDKTFQQAKTEMAAQVFRHLLPEALLHGQVAVAVARQEERLALAGLAAAAMVLLRQKDKTEQPTLAAAAAVVTPGSEQVTVAAVQVVIGLLLLANLQAVALVQKRRFLFPSVHIRLRWVQAGPVGQIVAAQAVLVL
jgi:hypothetical protein